MWITVSILAVVIVLLLLPHPDPHRNFPRTKRKKPLQAYAKNQITGDTKIRSFYCLNEKLFKEWLEKGAKIQAIEKQESAVLGELQTLYPKTFSYLIVADAKCPYDQINHFLLFDYPYFAWTEGSAKNEISKDCYLVDTETAPFDQRHRKLLNCFQELFPEKSPTV